jgi:hypothetical protein
MEPTGRAADARHVMFQEIIRIAIKVQAIVGDGTLCCSAQASSSVGPDSERFKFQGTRHQLAAAEQPRASSVLEPERPETAGRVLLDLASRAMTSKPDE